MNVYEIRRPERPHRHDPTEKLKAALAGASQDAQRYARTGPKQYEDMNHLMINEFLDELETRGELADPGDCWCGHPRGQHWNDQSGRMTFPDGCHDCPGWNGAHAYGQELPWLPDGDEAEQG